MLILHEVATMTAKGQITLPKAIRQALGVDIGAKVAFELHENGRVVVSRANADHEDPAIGAFLNLLSDDIQTGRHVQGLPDDLVEGMLEHARRGTRLDDDIDAAHHHSQAAAAVESPAPNVAIRHQSPR